MARAICLFSHNKVYSVALMKQRPYLALVLLIILLIPFSSFGQMVKYRHCKNEVLLENYLQQVHDPKYSPVAAGVLNFVFPAAGYLYVGEPLRGAGVFAAELAAFSVFVMGISMSMWVDQSSGYPPAGARETMFVGIVATGIIRAWAIVDVVRVAKVKNMAFQSNGYALKLMPDLQYGNQNNAKYAIAGIRLTANF